MSLSIGVRELVEFPQSVSFRLLKWENRIDEVFLVNGPGLMQPVKGEGTHWHFHRALEVTAFTSGSGIWFVGDRIQRFSSGSVVFLGGNLPHYWHVTDKCSGYSVQFYFPPSHPIWGFEESREFLLFLDKTTKGIAYKGACNQQIISLFEGISESDGLRRLGLLFELFSVLCGASELEMELLSSQTFWLSGESEQQNSMRTAMHYILTHFREEIRLEDLLNVTHMSRATFSRYFKKHTGKSLYKVVQEIRIEAACKDLAETHKPITEIVMESGFSQISFFNRTFQRIVKCSPSEFRRHHFG